jgi:hypothetical protein
MATFAGELPVLELGHQCLTVRDPPGLNDPRSGPGLGTWDSEERSDFRGSHPGADPVERMARPCIAENGEAQDAEDRGHVE